MTRRVRRVPAAARRRRSLAVGAAGLVIVGCLATYAAGHPTAVSASGPPVPASAAPRGEDAAHQAAATSEAQRLVTWVDLPAAHPAASAPAAILHEPTSRPMSSDIEHQIHRTAFWIVPNRDAIGLSADLRSRTPPIADAAAGTGRESEPDPLHPGSRISATSIMWLAGEESTAATDAYAMPELDVTFFQDGEAVDVRADAWVSWRPARPISTDVDADEVSSVRVTYRPDSGTTDPGGSVVVSDPQEIAELSSLVNGLSVLPPGGVRSCPVIVGRSATATLAFASAGVTQQFTWAPCPGSVTTSATNADHIAFEPGDFVSTVRRLAERGGGAR